MTKEGKTTGEKEKKRKNIFPDDGGNEEQRESPAKRHSRSTSGTPVKDSSDVDVGSRRAQIREGKRPVSESGPQTGSTRIKIRVPKLPPKLLDRSDIPKVGKINSYSKPDYLLAITEVLHGTPEYQTLLDSDLGRVFELSTKRGAMSGKVTHNLLCRMLLTRKRRELWFVFANKPIRYSLKEFGYLTGMNCGPYPPTDQKFIDLSKSKDAYWHDLIGPNQTGLIRDLVLLLQRDYRLPEEERMPMSRRFRLALVILVDGVLCCKNSATVKASRLTVQRVKDIDSFLAYPWGRESFELTLEMVTPGNFQNPTIDDLIRRLTGQANVAIKGFSAAFQLLLYETCSNIKAVLEENEDVTDFTDPTMVELPKSKNFSNSTIAKIEDNPKTTVISILDYGFKLVGGDFSWPDEVQDPSVDHMLSKIEEGHQFKKDDWIKGRIELPPNEGDEKTKKSKKTGKGTLAKVEEEEEIDSLSDDEPSKYRLKLRSGKRAGKPHGLPKKRARVKVAEDLFESEDQNTTVDKVWQAMLPEIEIIFKKYLQDAMKDHLNGKNDGGGTSTTKAKHQQHSSPLSEYQNIVCGLQADTPKKQVKSLTNSETGSPKSVKGVLNELKDTGMLDEKGLEDSDEESESERLVRKKAVEIENSNVEKESFDLDDVLTEKLEESNIGSEKTLQLTPYCPPKDVQEDEMLNIDQFDDEVQLLDEDFTKPVLEENKSVGGVNQMSEPGKETTMPESHPPNVDGRKTNIDIEDTSSKQPEYQKDEAYDDDTNKKLVEEETSKVVVPHSEKDAEEQTENSSEDDIRQEPVEESEDLHKPDAKQDTTVTGCEGSSKDIGDAADSGTLGVRQPSTRNRKKTVKFGQEESNHGLGPVDKALVKKFLNCLAAYIPPVYMITEGGVSKTFFYELYTKSYHVNTTHMDLILDSVWGRCAEEFLKNRCLLVDIFFIQHLLTDHITYPFNQDSRGDFTWHKTIQKVVEGRWSKRPGNIKWYEDVDKVYSPMHWEPDHWVGLCIDLVEGRITIFDSQINYVKRSKMMKNMQPLMEILPELVNHIASTIEDSDLQVPTKFSCERPSSVSQNPRSGDCGPLAIKYMELHALGKPLDGITDKMVDNLRMRYAIDVYQKLVHMLT